MNPTLRRILQITAFVAAIIAFGWIIFAVFFKPTQLVPTNNGGGFVNGVPITGNRNAAGNLNISNINALPAVNALPNQEPTTTAQGGPTLINTVEGDASSTLTFAPSGSTFRYYDRTKGQFFELTADGTGKTRLSDAMYNNVSSINWSTDGTKAILTFPDSAKILYDFTTKKQSTVPRELNDFSFSPQSDQTVSKFLNPANPDDQWLMVAQPDGSSAQTVEHLGENAGKVIPTWSPNNQIVATYEKASTGDLSEVIFLGANGENFPSATIQGRGFIPRWSPDGRKILYSSYSATTNDNPHLYMMNGSPDNVGSNLIDLGLDTSADKCAFTPSGTSIYCAVPYYLNPGSGPEPELSAGIPDNIYRIDLLNGTSELVARPVDANGAQHYSATNLQISPSEDSLFFVDAGTGSIQKIQLR